MQALHDELIVSILRHLTCRELCRIAIVNSTLRATVDRTAAAWTSAAAEVDPMFLLGPAALRAGAMDMGWLSLTRLLAGSQEIPCVVQLPAPTKAPRVIRRTRHLKRHLVSLGHSFTEVEIGFAVGAGAVRPLLNMFSCALNGCDELWAHDERSFFIAYNSVRPGGTVRITASIEFGGGHIAISRDGPIRLLGDPPADAPPVNLRYESDSWLHVSCTVPVDRRVVLRSRFRGFIIRGEVVLENLVIHTGDISVADERHHEDDAYCLAGDDLNFHAINVETVSGASTLLMRSCDVFSETGSCVVLDPFAKAYVKECLLLSMQFFGVCLREKNTLTVEGCDFRGHCYALYCQRGILSVASRSHFMAANVMSSIDDRHADCWTHGFDRGESTHMIQPWRSQGM